MPKTRIVIATAGLAILLIGGTAVSIAAPNDQSAVTEPSPTTENELAGPGTGANPGEGPSQLVGLDEPLEVFPFNPMENSRARGVPTDSAPSGVLAFVQDALSVRQSAGTTPSENAGIRPLTESEVADKRARDEDQIEKYFSGHALELVSIGLDAGLDAEADQKVRVLSGGAELLTASEVKTIGDVSYVEGDMRQWLSTAVRGPDDEWTVYDTGSDMRYFVNIVTGEDGKPRIDDMILISPERDGITHPSQLSLDPDEVPAEATTAPSPGQAPPSPSQELTPTTTGR